MRKRLLAATSPAFCFLIVVTLCAGESAAAVVKVGAGSYLEGLPAGTKGPPTDIYVTENVRGPVPTNDWCSTLFWEKFGNPHYAHPLAMQAMPAGLRLFNPGPGIAGTKDAIFGFMPSGKLDLVIGHAAVEAFAEKRVDGFSDGFVDVLWKKESATLRTTYGHCSPFVFCRIAGGDAKITFAETPRVWAGDGKAGAIGLSIGAKHYGLFAESGATWSGLDGKVFTCKFAAAASAGRLTVALLPDDKPETLALFAKYASNEPSACEVSWNYNAATADVASSIAFRPTANALMPGSAATLLALYPHQWRHGEGVHYTGHTYPSVRGTMKLAIIDRPLVTHVKFPGVLPALPRLAAGGADATRVISYLRKELADDPSVHDSYGEGKLLGKWAGLIALAEQYGLEAEATLLTQRVKTRLEDWLTAGDASGKPKIGKRLFAYEPKWGTLIGYPAGFGSDVELNDHHFHYGYFIRAAAEVARRDPAWAKDDRFGGMIKMLIRDIASPERQDDRFCFLRNFDPLAGHSWASGHGRFADGNNQESSSEAMNAWYGMILLGEVTGDTKLRDLGIYLYTTEMTAIDEYWFNVTGENFPKGYAASVVTMVWGGKGANGTWFSAEPEAVHGINFLPMTAGSLYLGTHPAYVEKNWQAMLAERKGGELRQWRDVLLMYHALSDPADALKRFDAIAEKLKPEDGNTLAGTYHWIATLNGLGQLDPTVYADQPLAATFTRGGKKTHVAYRGAKPVHFSDGITIEAGKPGWTTDTNRS